MTPSPLPADLIQLQADWEFVGKSFQDGADECQSCAFREVHRERVGLFPNVAESVTSECTLGRCGERASECPALVAERFAAMDETMSCGRAV